MRFTYNEERRKLIINKIVQTIIDYAGDETVKGLSITTKDVRGYLESHLVEIITLLQKPVKED